MSNENNVDESGEERIVVDQSPQPVPPEDVPPQEAPVQHAEFFSPYTEVDLKEAAKHDTITVFGEHINEDVIEQAAAQEQQILLSSDPSDEKVADFVKVTASLWEAAAVQYPGNQFVEAVNNQTRDWMQRIIGDKGKKIGINSIRFDIADSDVLEGPNVVRYIRSKTGIGNVTRIPMWSSGIVLTIDSFREHRLLDLHNVLVRQRLDLGTETRGASFSGDDVYTVNAIVEFILDHVIDCSVLNWTVPLLRTLIRPTDIPVLLAGALSGIYPRGYPLFHQCIYNFRRDPETGATLCNTAITSKTYSDTGIYIPDTMLDFKRVVWVDNARLTPVDRLHMSATKPTHKVDEVMAYQARVNYVAGHEKGAELFSSPDFKLIARFKNPSLDEYSKSSTAWCTRVIEMVDKTMAIDSGLSEEDRLERRNIALNEYAATVTLLKQTHWVDYLLMVDQDGKERKIIDAKTIDETLAAMAAEEGFVEQFESKVQQYKEDVAFAFTGYPNFACPGCGRGQTDPNQKYPTLIPINMVSYFFILMVWRNRTPSATKRI